MGANSLWGFVSNHMNAEMSRGYRKNTVRERCDVESWTSQFLGLSSFSKMGCTFRTPREKRMRWSAIKKVKCYYRYFLWSPFLFHFTFERFLKISTKKLQLVLTWPRFNRFHQQRRILSTIKWDGTTENRILGPNLSEATQHGIIWKPARVFTSL